MFDHTYWRAGGYPISFLDNHPAFSMIEPTNVIVYPARDRTCQWKGPRCQLDMKSVCATSALPARIVPHMGGSLILRFMTVQYFRVSVVAKTVRQNPKPGELWHRRENSMSRRILPGSKLRSC